MAFSLRSLLAALALISLAVMSAVEARHVKRPAEARSVDLSKYSPTLSNALLPERILNRYELEWQIFGTEADDVLPGSASLPAPLGMTLKALTLGRGTQNYTCAPGSTAAPVSVGAVAELLDVSALLPLLPADLILKILNQLPSYLINYSFDHISKSSIPACGRHYFTAAGIPFFDLGKKGSLSGKKSGAIAAPGGADVDWLQLTAIAPSTLKAVYRVHTAKGKPPKSCQGQPAAIQVQYAAQYWFYA